MPTSLRYSAMKQCYILSDRGIQLVNVHRFFLMCAMAALVALKLDHQKNQLIARELHFLRDMESALHHPVVGVDRSRLVRGARSSQRAASSESPCVDATVGSGEPRIVGLF